jgi:predicted phosphodiesterase
MNMKRALISDIHGNLEALTAVLGNIADQGIDEIYCLGDIIGYGPNPCECIDLVMQCKVCVLGNHDQGALFDPEGFSSGAEKAIFWTRDQLEQGPGDAAQKAKRWDYLCDLPRIHRENGLMLVHGSARNPLNEYVFPEDTFNVRTIDKIFALVDRVCFQGHTHVPGVFVQNYQFLSPQDIDGRYTLDGDKVLINVGSVGQPRDGNPRSCYAVLDGNDVSFHRVEYPAQVTADKIYAIAELDNFLGDRLLEGR